MLSSLQRCWLGPCNGMHHPLCSAIWLSGNSGASLLPARRLLLRHLLRASCLTGCCKIPVARALLLVFGKLCPGCPVLLAFRRCSKHLTLQLLKRSCMRPTLSHGVKPYPFYSALSAGWNAWSCRLISMLPVACSAPYGVPCVGRMPCGWPHPPFRYSWKRAAWLGYRPELRRPRRVCAGVPCCLALLGLRLRAGACHFGRRFLRFCTSHIVQTPTASLISCRPCCQVQPLRPLY